MTVLLAKFLEPYFSVDFITYCHIHPDKHIYQHITLKKDIGHFKAGQTVRNCIVDFVNEVITLHGFYDDDDGISNETEYEELKKLFEIPMDRISGSFADYIGNRYRNSSFKPTFLELIQIYNNLHELRRERMFFKVEMK